MARNEILPFLREQVPTMSVGIITADLMNLGSELSLLERLGVKIVHFDVMDGRFSPFMTVGPLFVKGIRTRLLKDVHLMIERPLERVNEYVEAGADMVTVHAETDGDILAVLRRLGELNNVNDPDRGLVRGLAVNPATPTAALEPLLGDAEMVSVLAVNPTMKGFPPVDSIARRFKEIRDFVHTGNKDILLCIDGGVKRSNIGEIAELGADIVVSGSAIFDGKAAAENARFMLEAVKAGSDRGRQ
ncbi:MAG: ribulose-phosphate 3-epimerase [Candidatus Eiseniibacteriota bacterium]|nr:MAG: ribulose-phosphate 3-epimerase [Candidatus Eisenbacteria bacterium]